MTDRELFKMALDALECWQRNEDCNEPMSSILEALRARLAEDEIHDGWYRVDAWVKEKDG